MKIAFFIYAPQKGLLCSIGKELQNRGHEAVFMARDTNVAFVIRRHFSDIPEENLVVLSELKVPIRQIVDDCLGREDIYEESFAMLCAHDRALGKGYLLNTPGHPEIIKAWWGKEKKYSQVLMEFLRYETALDCLAPDMVIGVSISKVAHLVCRNLGITVKILTPPRFGSLYRWTTDEYESCPELDKVLKEKVVAMQKTDVIPDKEYNQTNFAQYFFAKNNYSHIYAIRTAFYRIFLESYQLIRGTHKLFLNSYGYLSWIGPILRTPHIFNYFLKHGVYPKDLVECKFVLFPLQMEPETSLLFLSPELNNTIELISWVSKSLPADMFVVVKEQPDSFGIRNRLYYDNLRRMPNVLLAHPNVNSRDWIKSSNLVITITSTMGFEAVAQKKARFKFWSTSDHQSSAHSGICQMF